MSTNQSNQFWLRIFWIFQNPCRFGRSWNNEKCSKLDSLPPRIFLGFYSIPSYFPILRFEFGLYLNLEIPLSGVHLSATSSPCARAHLLGISSHLDHMSFAAVATLSCPIPTAAPAGFLALRAAAPWPAVRSNATGPPRRLPGGRTARLSAARHHR
jgi:hypothetical protein